MLLQDSQTATGTRATGQQKNHTHRLPNFRRHAAPPAGGNGWQVAYGDDIAERAGSAAAEGRLLMHLPPAEAQAAFDAGRRLYAAGRLAGVHSLALAPQGEGAVGAVAAAGRRAWDRARARNGRGVYMRQGGWDGWREGGREGLGDVVWVA